MVMSRPISRMVGLFGLALALLGCSGSPDYFDPSAIRISTAGDVVRVTEALIVAKAEAEDIAIGCDRLRFDDVTYQRYDASWTRNIAELGATSPRILFDGFRRMGYVEGFDVFTQRLRDNGGVPDLPGAGEGQALLNIGGFPAVNVERDLTASCDDADRARRKGQLAAAFLMPDPFYRDVDG